MCKVSVEHGYDPSINLMTAYLMSRMKLKSLWWVVRGGEFDLFVGVDGNYILRSIKRVDDDVDNGVRWNGRGRISHWMEKELWGFDTV